MAIPSGLSAQLGIGQEGTYGTFVAPSVFIPFNTESVVLAIERLESMGLGKSTTVQHSDLWDAGKRQAQGSIELDVLSKGFNIIWTQILGVSAMTSPDDDTRDHSHTIGELTGTSASWQIGRPDTGGTVRPFSYTGVKVVDWELSMALDEYLKLSVNIDAQNESTSETLGTASYASAAYALPFTGATITIGGNSYTIKSMSIKGTTGVETESYGLGAATKNNPVQESLREITVDFELEFESLVVHNLFTGGSTAEIVATCQANTLIEGSMYPYVKVTLPTVRFDGEGPQVGGPGKVLQTLTGKALYDGTNEPITLVYRTTDTTTYASASPSLSPSVSVSLSPSASSSPSASPSLSPSASPSPS